MADVSASPSSSSRRSPAYTTREEGDGTSAVSMTDVERGVFVKHMLAGAVAGTVEHTAMFPVDTVKVGHGDDSGQCWCMCCGVVCIIVSNACAYVVMWLSLHLQQVFFAVVTFNAPCVSSTVFN